MTNYEDPTKWVMVESSEADLSLYEEYQPEQLLNIFECLIEDAESKGLEGCHLRFESNADFHDGYLENPSVSAVGYRKHTQIELTEMEEGLKVDSLSEGFGITYPEAKLLLHLQEKGYTFKGPKDND